MSNESSSDVKAEDMTAKEESYDVKVEDVPISDSTKALRTNSVTDTPKLKRTRMLFSQLPSVKEEALMTFTEIQGSVYQDEELGESSQQVDIMSCECKPVISDNGLNMACGDNDCINFATSMECTDDDECHCGIDCRNRRFQRREYADIDVIQTENKGFGIRANAAIPAHTFIYEYVGEVIEENTFRSRMHDYDEQGIKHFYFMMIQQGEYIDATKKGGLGRFINHSCSPNCYVDKWVIGTKLRMGIFSDRHIQAGEELTFDYNVDRYGADAQRCYCDEPNCIGFIGGKTQSEAQPKLSHAVKEALGFDDEMDWATAIARKRRRPKKDDDEDDDYVVGPQTRPVTEDGVARIMSALLQAREKWVITKLLTRLQLSDDNAIWHRVLKMHGYHILGAVLKEWNADSVIVTTVLNILLKLPRYTKNKIDDSRIEGTVKDLTENHHSRVKELATTLLEEWSRLEVAFRISRRPKGSTTKSTSPSKDGTTSDSSKTPTAPTNTTTTPTAPKAIQNTLHRPAKVWHSNPRITNDNLDPFRGVPRGPAAATSTPLAITLPPGWKSAFDPETSKTYYYRRSDGKTQWEIPVDESLQGVTLQKSEFQKIIDEAPRHLAEKLAAEKAEEERRRMEVEKEEKEAAEAKARERAERKLKRDERNQRRLAESGPQKPKSRLERELEIQFSSYVPNTIVRYSRTLAKDEVKRYAREITHELVKKEIKAGKTIIEGPLSDHKKQKIKDFVKVYMGKVMARKAQKEAARKQRQQQEPGPSESVSTATPQLPESTPRTATKGETPVVNDSAPTAVDAGENGNGEVKGFSPTEFLKTLEMDGLLQG